MKKLYTLLFSFFVLSVSAQVANVSVSDCYNNMTSIYGVLATGKVLVVASDGLDCSICKSKAPALQNWAAQNKTKIQVWGAMTYTYSNNNATCSGINAWVGNYGWSDIFAFADVNRHWFMSGTPRYTVYSPLDSTLAYQGFDESLALSTALQIAGNTTVGLSEISQKPFYVSQSSGAVQLHNLPKGMNEIKVISLTGRVVKSTTITNMDGNSVINSSDLNAGVYLVNAQNNKGYNVVKKVHIK